MEYLYYIAAVLFMGLACFVAIHFLTKNNRVKTAIGEEQKRRAMPAAELAARKSRGNLGFRSKPASSNPIIQREVQRTRVPWGWPNHAGFNGSEQNRPGLSKSMRSLADRLVREKTLASSQSVNSRASESVRALIEDRYGPVNKKVPAAVEYEKVKRPLLRDPRAPHDQMDNFGTSEAEALRIKLDRVAAMNSEPRKSSAQEKLRYIPVKDIKQPWGW